MERTAARPALCTSRFALALVVSVLSGCTGAPAPSAPVAPAPTIDPLVVVTSENDHGETVRRAVEAIESRGFVITQRIDHSAAAQSAGLVLEPTTVLVFGNPKAGTPLMQASSTMGLDLPLRVLVSERAGGVQVVYRAPAVMAAAHGAKDHPVVGKMAEALAAIADAAAGR